MRDSCDGHSSVLILLTVDITEPVAPLHTLPGHRVGSLRRTKEEEFCLQTLCPTEGLTLRVSATFRRLQDQTDADWS